MVRTCVMYEHQVTLLHSVLSKALFVNQKLDCISSLTDIYRATEACYRWLVRGRNVSTTCQQPALAMATPVVDAGALYDLLLLISHSLFA